MSILCSECGAPLAGSYQILCLLGHTKTGLVSPEESQIRQLVCQKHAVQPWDKVEKSRLQQTDADSLMFAVVPGTPSMDGNLNGGYLMDQDGALKENGDFDRAAYLTSVAIRTTFPGVFELLLAEAKDWPAAFVIYKTGVEQYRRANITHQTQRQEQEETNRQERICEVERVEQMRQQHAGLLRSAVENALVKRTVPLDVVSQLDMVGLLQSSTSFRSGSLFPGECSILRYEFDETERRMGFLGFDENNALLSIDERYPGGQQLYRKGTIEVPDWVELN